MHDIRRDRIVEAAGVVQVAPAADSVIAALRQASGPGKRSTLQAWMFEHQAELAAFIAAGDWPGWRALARALADLGLRDARGKPATEASARLTWFYLRRRAKAAITKVQASPHDIPASAPVGMPRAPAPALSPTQPQRRPRRCDDDIVEDDDDANQRPREPEFRFAAFKS